jgi:hypothetical protein
MATMTGHLSRNDVETALRELNALCLDEYGTTLDALLQDTSPMSEQRLQRLTGILLKRPFAIKSGRPSYSATAANFSWPWANDSPGAHKASAPAELALLNELRQVGPWQDPGRTLRPGQTELEWDEFKDDVEHERGLFKVLALWVNDKVRRQEGKSFKEYLEASESKHLSAGLDLATVVFESTVLSPVAALVGIPSVAVGVALVGIRYGHRLFTDPETGRHGDSAN